MTRGAVRNTSLSIALVVIVSFIASASAQEGKDTAAIDTFIARQAKRERGEEYPDARKVIAGDLTGDGVPETVVLYTIEGQGGSNNYLQYIAVFAQRTGGLVALTHARVGGKSIRSVELNAVDNKSILLDTLNYGPKDPNCCPTVKGTTAYVLSGKTLREQKPGAAQAPHD